MRAASRPDPVFAEYGFARPSTTRSGKSNAPDLMRPIAFTFRLRQVFGVGSRAEVIRFLLTASGTSPGAANPLFTAAVIADAAAYAKRNVQEALNSLALAGAIRQRRRGNELVYSIDTMRWRSFLLGDSPIPQYRDWSQALFTARELHRWITHAESVSLTPYMLASEARRFAEQILPSLYQAGIAVQDPSAAEGEAYWPAFTKLVADFLAQLDSLRPW